MPTFDAMPRFLLLLFLFLPLPLSIAPVAGADPEEDPLSAAEDLVTWLRPMVEAECGAKFEEAPQVLRLSVDAAAGIFEEDLREQVKRLYPDATEGQRATLLRSMAAASAASCLARYSIGRRRILLVDAGFARQARALGIEKGAHRRLLASALAHELVHALDDQRFDLASIYRSATDREGLRAAAMVVEGRAVVFGRGALARTGEIEDFPDLVPESVQVEDARDALFALTYRSGAAFVTALVAKEGVALADRALVAPPRHTHYLFHPERWPDGELDETPGAVLARAFPEAGVHSLSELELRARYLVLDGAKAAAALFAGYRGGAGVLVGESNAAVLSFAEEADAVRFLDRSRQEVPAERRGHLVLRVAGKAPRETLERIVTAVR